MTRFDLDTQLDIIDGRISEIDSERCELVSRRISTLSIFADEYMEETYGIRRSDKVRIVYKHYITRESTTIEGFYGGSYFSDKPQIQLKRDMMSEMVYSDDCPLIDDIESVELLEAAKK